MFLTWQTAMAAEPDPGGGVDMNDPVALAALVERLMAGETLTTEELEGAKRYTSVHSVEESVSIVSIERLGDADGAAADSDTPCKSQTVTP